MAHEKPWRYRAHTAGHRVDITDSEGVATEVAGLTPAEARALAIELVAVAEHADRLQEEPTEPDSTTGGADDKP